MTEEFGTFTNFITKGFGTEVTKDNRRIVKGHITVEVVDRQNEFVAVDEVLSVIKNYFEIYPTIHDWHSNRPVGKALLYKKSKIEGHDSVYIEAEIYKQDGVTLYDKVWDKIVKGEYTGFSMGGASMIREPMVKDGKLVMNLKNLELYEISVCPLPANQLAIFDYVNDFAKASGLDIKENLNGRRYIQCEGVQCQFHKMEKAYGDEVKDLGKKDETQIVPNAVGGATVFGVEKTGGMLKSAEKKLFEIISNTSLNNIEKGLEIRDLFAKQYQSFNTSVRGYPWSYWQNKLKEENPEMTDDEVNSTIGYWEKQEKEKSQLTKQMSREAELKMDDAPSGDKDEKILEKDHIPSMTEEQEKKIHEKTKTEDEMATKETVVKDAGMQNSQAKSPNVKNIPMKKSEGDVDIDIENTGGQIRTKKVRKTLESMIRKNTIINMLLNTP